MLKEERVLNYQFTTNLLQSERSLKIRQHVTKLR